MSEARIFKNRKPRILIIDDEDFFRMLVVDALQQSGDYEIFEADNGRTAQEILKGNSIDIAITDLQMPELDGLSLVQWAEEKYPGSLWIIISGQGSFDDAIRAVQLGAFDFLTKPLPTLDSLTLSVRNALRQIELEAEREQLHLDIEERNVQLRKKVIQLEEACRLLTQQAQQIKEDIRRAELIQRSLLPQHAPNVPGIAVDTCYRPSQHVGGDLYDIVLLNNNYLMFYVADAAGHGVSAAMLAVLFKQRLEMIDFDTELPLRPDEVLERVNRCLIKECKAPGLFVTAAYCLLNIKTGILQVASAGHPPIILVRDGTGTKCLYHTGPGLGISQQAKFSYEEIALQEGDRLLIYTDGLLNSIDEDPPDNEEIGAAIADLKNDGKTVLQKLFTDASNRQKGEQEDDISLLMITAADLHSSVDNGEINHDKQTATTAAVKPGVEMGEQGNHVHFRVSGRATWSQCPQFHSICTEKLKKGMNLHLDFSGCSYLDSTFLGTIQEIVDLSKENNSTIALEGATPQIRDFFEELGMDRVLSNFQPKVTTPDSLMKPLEPQGYSEVISGMRMLNAHSALAALSPDNKQEFDGLIDQLRKELDKD